VESGSVGAWLDVADARELQHLRRLVVSVTEPDEHEILLLWVRGRVVAVENVCPHAASALTDAKVSRRTLTCRVHGLSFDLTSGRQRRRPYQAAAGPLTRFGTRIDAGRVQVELSPLP